jgi:hypothetical protein
MSRHRLHHRPGIQLGGCPGALDAAGDECGPAQLSSFRWKKFPEKRFSAERLSAARFYPTDESTRDMHGTDSLQIISV